MNKKVKDAMAYKKSKNMPTLADMKKTVPKGGLLNPALRKGITVGGKTKAFKMPGMTKLPKVKGVF